MVVDLIVSVLKHLPGQHEQDDHGGEYRKVWGRKGYVKVYHFSGTKTYKLSNEASALREDDRYVWETDLLSAIDGKRQAAFQEDYQDKRIDTRDGHNLSALAKEHGLEDFDTFVVTSEKEDMGGLIIVSNKKFQGLIGSRNEFIDIAAKYLLGEGAKKGFTERQQRILGSWLGFPKESTDKYLENLNR
jgi:hypothetical protein